MHPRRPGRRADRVARADPPRRARLAYGNRDRIDGIPPEAEAPPYGLGTTPEPGGPLPKCSGFAVGRDHAHRPTRVYR